MFLAVADAVKLTTKIAADVARLEGNIQAVAECAIYHSNIVGDQNCDIGIKLIEALGRSQKSTSLKVYMAKFGQFGLKDPEDSKSFGFVKDAAKQIKADDTVKIAQLHAVLQANKWFDAVREPEVSQFLEADKEVARLVAKIKKAIAAKKTINWGTDKVAEVVRLMVVEGADLTVNTTEEIKELISK